MSGHLREWRRDRYRTGQHSTNDVHTSLEKKNNCDLVNHQHFRLVSSTKVKIDLVLVFIYKDPFSSRLMLRFHLDDIRAALIGNEWRRSPVRRATNRRRLPSKVDEPLTLCKCGPGGNQSV